MKFLLDKDFRYDPSFATDIRRRFERVRKELEAKREQAKTEQPKFIPIRKKA
jgi:hypothetical protein